MLGERPCAPRGATAVRRRRAAAVAATTRAHGGHREQHLRAPPRGRLALGVGIGLGVGGVERGGALGSVGAGGGGPRRDAGGGGGLADAGEWERKEVVDAAHVDAAAGGDAVGDGGHLLVFLLCAPRFVLPSSSSLHGVCLAVAVAGGARV